MTSSYDGVLITPKDVNGNIVEPFIYNGTTYLPIRAVGETLGKAVDWDGETSSVYVGKKPDGGAAFTKEVPPYERSYTSSIVTRDSITMGGTMYYDSITFKSSNQYSTETEYSLHNLNAQYTSISGYLGHVDGTSMYGATFNFYGDGKLLATYDLSAQDLPIEISLNVTGVLQLKVEVTLSYAAVYAFAGTIE